MKVSPEITYRNTTRSETIDNLIMEKIAKLETICDHLISCRVAVEKPHEHQQSGRNYRVRIEMSIPPNHDLVVKKESSGGDMHAELPTVIRNAFDAAFRQVKKLTDKQQGKTKQHPRQQVTAFIVRLFKDKGYGFLKTVDGREVYFHRNSVVYKDFDDLEPGDGVSFVEEAGKQGPQASSVHVVDKPASI